MNDLIEIERQPRGVKLYLRRLRLLTSLVGRVLYHPAPLPKLICREHEIFLPPAIERNLGLGDADFISLPNLTWQRPSCIAAVSPGSIFIYFPKALACPCGWRFFVAI
jgi:hypothetical protein